MTVDSNEVVGTSNRQLFLVALFDLYPYSSTLLLSDPHLYSLYVDAIFNKAHQLGSVSQENVPSSYQAEPPHKLINFPGNTEDTLLTADLVSQPALLAIESIVDRFVLECSSVTTIYATLSISIVSLSQQLEVLLPAPSS